GEHFDDGGFAAAIGPEEAEDFALFHAKADVVDRGELAEAANETLGDDGGLLGVGHGSALRGQDHIGGHAGAHTVGRIVNTGFHAEDLVGALFYGLHVTRKEFGLLVDLFDRASKNLVGERIHANLGFLAQMDAANLRFGNVDADVNLIALEKRGDGSIGG